MEVHFLELALDDRFLSVSGVTVAYLQFGNLRADVAVCYLFSHVGDSERTNQLQTDQ